MPHPCPQAAVYPITVITNARRAQNIEALVQGQTSDSANRPGTWGAATPLTALVAHACRESFVEYLRLLSKAADTESQGITFYQVLLAGKDVESEKLN